MDNARRYGQHYTPPELADRLVAPMLERIPAGGSVLDPSCGDGALLAAVKRARPDVRTFGYDIEPGPDAPKHGEIRQADFLFDVPVIPRFDAIVMNPPFIGGKRIRAHLGDEYQAKLRKAFPDVHGNADFAAYHIRRAFEILRPGGVLAIIATNTIAQGDTRESGLAWIVENGGHIVAADRRVKWPGQAAVVVSLVWIVKEPGHTLNSHLVRAPEMRPARLAANARRSFIGSCVLGMGFTFDDTNPKATPIAEMQRLIAKNPRNQERVFPYLGGEELNTSPTHAHHRYVINFGQMSEAEARAWPDLMAIVEAKVKPERATKSADLASYPWWRFWRPRPALYAAIAGMERVLVLARTSKHIAVTWMPAGYVFSENVVVFAMSDAGFSLLQSTVHLEWVRQTSSTLEDRQGYRPTDCFETFPFSANWEGNAALEASGQAYYEFRAELMVRTQLGMTKTYNRFHDPDEDHADIVELRRLHAAMDRAVLEAYGWSDLIAQAEAGTGFHEQLDESLRYGWDEATKAEVLGRLLKLNAERAAEEAG